MVNLGFLEKNKVEDDGSDEREAYKHLQNPKHEGARRRWMVNLWWCILSSKRMKPNSGKA